MKPGICQHLCGTLTEVNTALTNNQTKFGAIASVTGNFIRCMSFGERILTRYDGQEYNFATSSASASDAFRSRERCTGYTGKGGDFPTGVS